MSSKEKVINILKEQLTSMCNVKNELIQLTSYEESVLFREFEKRIEKQLRILENPNLINEEKPKISLNTPYIEMFGIKSCFSKKMFRLLNNIELPIYTNKIVVEMLSRVNIVSNIILELGIDIVKLREDLESLILNDIVPKETPLMSLKSKRVISFSLLEAKQFNKNEITISILFLSILKLEEDVTTKLLNKYGITYELFLTKLELT